MLLSKIPDCMMPAVSLSTLKLCGEYLQVFALVSAHTIRQLPNVAVVGATCRIILLIRSDNAEREARYRRHRSPRE